VRGPLTRAALTRILAMSSTHSLFHVTPALSRRDLLRVAGVAAAMPLCSAAPFASVDVTRRAKKPTPLKIGIASYSLRKFPLERVISACEQMGVRYVTLKDVHLARTDPPETTRALRKKIEAAGITIMGGGTITWKENSEAEIRKDFEYAKNAGFPLMVCSPAPETLDTVEKLVKEYDIKVAIHNHGPEDKWYPAPKDALDRIAQRDPRMGLCMDIGHAARANADIVEAVGVAGPRLLDLHVKDLADASSRESQVDVGRGVLDIPGLFRALVAAKFPGHVSLEYEINDGDPFAGMNASLSYMRGVADALA
jgi:sugar phosphate isomerase/epimerase